MVDSLFPTSEVPLKSVEDSFPTKALVLAAKLLQGQNGHGTHFTILFAWQKNRSAARYRAKREQSPKHKDWK